MSASLESLAKDLGSRVNPWRASIEQPDVPAYQILYDDSIDQLFIASNGKCRQFAMRAEIDDHFTADAEWFRLRAQKIMREWESLPAAPSAAVVAAKLDEGA